LVVAEVSCVLMHLPFHLLPANVSVHWWWCWIHICTQCTLASWQTQPHPRIPTKLHVHTCTHTNTAHMHACASHNSDYLHTHIQNTNPFSCWLSDVVLDVVIVITMDAATVPSRLHWRRKGFEVAFNATNESSNHCDCKWTSRVDSTPLMTQQWQGHVDMKQPTNIHHMKIELLKANI